MYYVSHEICEGYDLLISCAVSPIYTENEYFVCVPVPDKAKEITVSLYLNKH